MSYNGSAQNKEADTENNYVNRFLWSINDQKTGIKSTLAETESPWCTTLAIAYTPVSFKTDPSADTSVSLRLHMKA